MNINLRGVLSSWTFTLVTILILWPPGVLYWHHMAEIIGITVTLGIISIFSVSVGLAFKKHTTITLNNVLLGNIIAYITVLLIVRLVTSPNSTVHFIFYGIILLGVIGGEVLEHKFGEDPAN